MLSYDDAIKTENLTFCESNENSHNSVPGLVHLDPKIFNRSEKSIHSLLSRIRNDFNVRNNEIHFIGLSGIHYVVILRQKGKKNLLGKLILPIKKSRDELVLRLMQFSYTKLEDISVLDDILKKVVESHSIIKKGKTVYKNRMYYYKLIMGETNQESLDKFGRNYGYVGKVDIGDFSRLADRISLRMESMGVTEDDQ